MTHREAREHGRSPGYAVRIGDECEQAYLADYRTCRIPSPYTYRPDRAEWFEYLADARDRAAQVTFMTGLRAEVCTIPPASGPVPTPPCRSVASAFWLCTTCGDTGEPGRACRCHKPAPPVTANASASVAGHQPCRCLKQEPTLTADDAFANAVEAFMDEADGDRLEALAEALEVVIADGRRYRLPVDAPRYLSNGEAS